MNHSIFELLTDLTTYKVVVDKEADHSTQTMEFYGKGAAIERISFNNCYTTEDYVKHLDTLFDSIKEQVSSFVETQSATEISNFFTTLLDRLRETANLISPNNYTTIGDNNRLNHPRITFIWKSGEVELYPTQELESYSQEGKWYNERIKRLIEPYLTYSNSYLTYCIQYFETRESYQKLEFNNLPLGSNSQPTINLPENFSLRKENLKIDSMTISQSTILFHYLREEELTINYNDSSLSKFIHYLTGHSEQNIRTKGLGQIYHLVNDSKKGVDFYDLKQVKQHLENIIKNIDDTINS